MKNENAIMEENIVRWENLKMEKAKVERIQSSKGITLIALVVTIIVLLILTGVSITTLTGDNGIITKAQEAKEKAEKAQIEEQLNLAILSAELKKQGGNITVDDVLEELRKQGINFKDSTEPSEGTFTKVITIDGKYQYGMNVTEKGNIEFKDIGQSDGDDTEKDTIPPNSFTPSALVSRVELKDASNETKQKYQFVESVGGGGHETGSIYLASHGTTIGDIIYCTEAPENDPSNLSSGYYKALQNVELYTGPAAGLGNTSYFEYLGKNYLICTITGSTTDDDSGIAKYYFSKDNGATWEPSEGQTETSYTFTGLKEGTTYTFKMKAEDRAGNQVESNPISSTLTLSSDTV